MDVSKVKIYSSIYPKIGEIVTIKINDNSKGEYVKAQVIDYNIEAIIPWNNLTTKKKIRNINKTVPINKNIHAKVESIEKELVVLTRNYIDKESEEFKHWHNEKESLRKIKSLLIKLKEDSDFVLKNVVYPIDEMKGEFVDLYQEIKDKYMDIEMSDELKQKITDIFDDEDKKIPKKSYRDVGLIAIDSVEDMKKQIINLMEKYTGMEITLKSTPIYSFSSYNKKELDEFIMELNENKDKKYRIKI